MATLLRVLQLEVVPLGDGGARREPARPGGVVPLSGFGSAHRAKDILRCDRDRREDRR